jgi:hypothetical protein
MSFRLCACTNNVNTFNVSIKHNLGVVLLLSFQRTSVAARLGRVAMLLLMLRSNKKAGEWRLVARAEWQLQHCNIILNPSLRTDGHATDSTRNLDPVSLLEIHEHFKYWVYSSCVQTLTDTSAATQFLTAQWNYFNGT